MMDWKGENQYSSVASWDQSNVNNSPNLEKDEETRKGKRKEKNKRSSKRI